MYEQFDMSTIFNIKRQHLGEKLKLKVYKKIYFMF